MPIANGAIILTKPKSILKVRQRPIPRASYLNGEICFRENNEAKREQAYIWVKRQNDAGLKVIYKNIDGTKGKLK